MNISFLAKNSEKIRLLAILILVLAGLGLLIYNRASSDNPVPTDIKKQLSFRTIYPQSPEIKVDTSSFNYQTDQKTLTFTVEYKGNDIVLTERQAPNGLTEAQNYQSIGVHPYSQIQTRLGLVALTRAYIVEKTYEKQGQLAVLAAKGTLLIATRTGDKELSDNDWLNLFNSMKVYK